MVLVNFLDTTYHIDNRLHRLWTKNSLAKLRYINTDKLYVVDGREGTGKSTFTIQQACFLDPSMQDLNVFLSRICFSAEEFYEVAKKVKNGVIIFDEAFRGFSSRAALSKTNKKLITGLMEMRQNNNIVFIVLPSFFMLDIYPAMLRSNALFNIYIDKRTKKRTFRAYNYRDKNKLYQIGMKKGWTYPFDTRIKGRFYDNREHTKFPGGMKFYNAYEDKKARAFRDADEEMKKATKGSGRDREQEYKDKFDRLLVYFMKYNDLSQKKAALALEASGLAVSASTLGRIAKDVSGKEG